MGRRRHRNTAQMQEAPSAPVSEQPQESAKEEGFFEYYGKYTGAFYGIIVIGLVIIGIASGIIYFCDGAKQLYDDAPIKVETQAVLSNIEEFEKEQKVLDPEYKDASPAERKRHTKTERYTLYVLTWEYEIDGKKQTIKESKKYYCSDSVGDTKDMRFYSYDGVEYKKAGYDDLTEAISGLCKLARLIVVIFIIRVIIERIVQKIRKRRTNRLTS